MLRLFDTALQRVAELEPRRPGEVSMYVCGPTVYGDPHVGHGRFTLVWDVLRRYLEWSGLDVRFVSNITDIDDKIIDRARAEGRSAADVADHYEVVWYDAMDALGVLRPDHDPHATAYLPQMVELIDDLVARDIAYPTADGVYFDTGRVADYGLLAGQPIDSLRAGERVAVVEEKRSPIDFALWKKAKPGEPQWDSPWGAGRPGWHTECVVMALDLLEEDFDLHGGGIDLAFPHHENERAQAVASGRRFARRWVHSGHVVAGSGDKMSKSLGNVLSLPELLAGTDPRAYRLLVLQAHYRSPMAVGPELLDHARQALGKIDELARRVARLYGAEAAAADPAALDRFRTLMDDDLGTPGATALIFGLVGEANTALDRGDQARGASVAAAALSMLGALGLQPTVAAGAVPGEVTALVDQREAARSAGDWPRADELRAEMAARGWTVKDTSEGPEVRQRPGPG